MSIEPRYTSVGAKPSTKRIINRIAAEKRWTVAVTVDEAAKALADREGINVNTPLPYDPTATADHEMRVADLEASNSPSVAGSVSDGSSHPIETCPTEKA